MYAQTSWWSHSYITPLTDRCIYRNNNATSQPPIICLIYRITALFAKYMKKIWQLKTIRVRNLCMLRRCERNRRDRVEASWKWSKSSRTAMARMSLITSRMFSPWIVIRRRSPHVHNKGQCNHPRSVDPIIAEQPQRYLYAATVRLHYHLPPLELHTVALSPVE
jgi:hypothetical protein